MNFPFVILSFFPKQKLRFRKSNVLPGFPLNIPHSSSHQLICSTRNCWRIIERRIIEALLSFSLVYPKLWSRKIVVVPGFPSNFGHSNFRHIGCQRRNAGSKTECRIMEGSLNSCLKISNLPKFSRKNILWRNLYQNCTKIDKKIEN